MPDRETIERLRQLIAEKQGTRPRPLGSVPDPESRDFAHALLVPGAGTPESPRRIEELVNGHVHETELGRYFCAETFYPAHRLHGSYPLSEVMGLEISPAATPFLPDGIDSRLSNWAFLDCETTGLCATGANYAFLIGVLSSEDGGMRLRQYFMRDADEEQPMLNALAKQLERFSVLATYNGAVYDLPILRARARACGSSLTHTLRKLVHADLLHPARRLWRLRLDRCRLIDIEADLFGLERSEDVAAALIPYLYFEFRRRDDALRVFPIFHHNGCDLLSLACLAAKLVEALGDPESQLHSARDRYALARWSAQKGNVELSQSEYSAALERHPPEELELAARMALAEQHRRDHNWPRAVEIWQDISGFNNPCRLAALERLAKYYERETKDCPRALDCVLTAIQLEDDSAQLEQWRAREHRLRTRIERQRLAPAAKSRQARQP